MAWVWTGMVLLSLIFGIATGNLDEVANAALEGAGSAGCQKPVGMRRH